jgi:hypothetical protein
MLGSNYENCTNQINNYRNSLLSGNEELIKANESALNAAIIAGESAEKYGLVAEEIEVQASMY